VTDADEDNARGAAVLSRRWLDAGEEPSRPDRTDLRGISPLKVRVLHYPGTPHALHRARVGAVRWTLLIVAAVL
jgi:hypothetical protein